MFILPPLYPASEFVPWNKNEEPWPQVVLPHHGRDHQEDGYTHQEDHGAGGKHENSCRKNWDVPLHVHILTVLQCKLYY